MLVSNLRVSTTALTIRAQHSKYRFPRIITHLHVFKCFMRRVVQICASAGTSSQLSLKAFYCCSMSALTTSPPNFRPITQKDEKKVSLGTREWEQSSIFSSTVDGLPFFVSILFIQALFNQLKALLTQDHIYKGDLAERPGSRFLYSRAVTWTWQQRVKQTVFEVQ